MTETKKTTGRGRKTVLKARFVEFPGTTSNYHAPEISPVEKKEEKRFKEYLETEEIKKVKAKNEGTYQMTSHGVQYPGREEYHSKYYKAHLRKKKGKFPGIFYCDKMMYAVCEDLKNEIERLEPGIHNFFPLEITLKNGKTPGIEYYLFKMNNYVDALCKKKSKLPNVSITSKGLYDFTHYSLTFPGNRAVFRKEIVGSLHIWRDVNVYGMGGFFLSYEMYRVFIDNDYVKFKSRDIYLE